MSKILLIEDSRNSLEICVRSLRCEGYHTLTASNGLEGVKLTQHEQPDLVICDVVMPQLDGYAVLSCLRKDPTTAVVPFIFWSGKASREEIRYGMELGADDYLTKPCSISEILSAIATRLSKQENLKQGFLAEFQNQASDFSPFESPSGSQSLSSIFPILPKLAKIFEFIEENFRDPTISLPKLAKATSYSPAYLTHLVKQKTERTVNAWIIERRMEEARNLLLEDQLTVKEIALQIGYGDPGYFMRQFKKHHQVSAKLWQQMNHL